MSRGAILLPLARASIGEALGGPAVSRGDDPSWLFEPGACFVTLRKNDDLRGCIGSLHAHRPLFDDVVENAKAAAFRDPRFPPLAAEELAAVCLEISVLSPPEPLEVQDEEDALRELRPGVDGVLLSWGTRRAVFIPKMWEQIPDPRQFLSQLRRKMGLPGPWLAGTRVARFTAESWEEGG